MGQHIISEHVGSSKLGLFAPFGRFYFIGDSIDAIELRAEVAAALKPAATVHVDDAIGAHRTASYRAAIEPRVLGCQPSTSLPAHALARVHMRIHAHTVRSIVVWRMNVWRTDS